MQTNTKARDPKGHADAKSENKIGKKNGSHQAFSWDRDRLPKRSDVPPAAWPTASRRRTAITPVFRPESCCFAAQLVAGPEVKRPRPAKAAARGEVGPYRDS